MNYFISEDFKFKDKLNIIMQNIINELNSDEFKGLDDIYLKSDFKQNNYFDKKCNFPDGYYWNNYQSRSSITINLNFIFNNKKVNNKYFVLYLIFYIIFSILLFPYNIYRVIKDKNIKFYYLYFYMMNPKVKSKNMNINFYEFELVKYLFFYLGIHHYYQIYGKNNKYDNINIYEKAIKYRNKKLDNYNFILLKDDIII